MLPLNFLGFLTVVAYGTWFYGFGVLFSDLSDFHGVSASTLAITFGIAQLLSGMGAVATGRRLDVFGPRAVLGIIGPVGAIIYFASSFTTGTMFLTIYAFGGGLIGAAGFYSFTQPLAVRIASTDSTQAITRLTIWGAFSSPVMIPLTEVLRSHYGWRTAVRLPAALTLIAFFVAAFVFQVPTMTAAEVSTGTAALLASVRGLMQLGGRIPLVSAIRKFTAPRLIIVSRYTLGVSALFLLGSGNIAFAVIYTVFAGVTLGALSALDGVAARDIVRKEVFGTVMGGIGLITTLGSAIGPIFSGWLKTTFDSSNAPSIVVFISACSAAIIFSIKPSSEKALATQP